MKAVEVLQRLERLHPPDHGEWLFQREVFNIDAYAVRLWRGAHAPYYRRVAYEVKVSRSDFLAELKRPEKRGTAVELSNQFYFAMPIDLAARSLADIVGQMPECGLLAVYPEDQTGLGSFVSPCQGAGYAPRVRMLRRAPLRGCRGWSAPEWSNLMRRHHRPEADADALRHELEVRHEQLKAERLSSKRAHKAREQAQRALALVAGHTVQPGQVWRGPWSEGRWYTGRPVGRRMVVAAIDQVELPRDYGGQGYVTLRLLNDDGEPVVGFAGHGSYDLGVFLALWSMSDRPPVEPPEWDESDDMAFTDLQSVAGNG